LGRCIFLWTKRFATGKETDVLFLGNDWAEAHHDIELQDGQCRVLVRKRLPGGWRGSRTCMR